MVLISVRQSTVIIGESKMLQLLVVASLLIFATEKVVSHQESGEWSCESELEIQVMADFTPGIITLDGRNDDWKDIEGSEFPLRPALDPDADHEYDAGKMTVKVKLADPDVVSNPSEYQKLAQSMLELDEVVSVFRRFKECEKQLLESNVLAKKAGDDEDMAEMIGSEINSLTKEIEELVKQVKTL